MTITATKEFLRVATDCGALEFGDFTLKSGRKSPYFMNLGRFATSHATRLVGNLLGELAKQVAPGGANLLGLPYKGIPLAALACSCVTEPDAKTQAPFNYCYLRKEAKAVGEGGTLVGSPDPKLPTILVDDVLTAGTAALEAIEQLSGLGIAPSALVVVFDREEAPLGSSTLARDHLAKKCSITVRSAVTVSGLLEHLEPSHSEAIQSHLREFGKTSKG